MSKLSPAAQAVWVAFKEAPMCAENKLVAALRAVADANVYEFADEGGWHSRVIDVDDIYAIADELEGAGND